MIYAEKHNDWLFFQNIFTRILFWTHRNVVKFEIIIPKLKFFSPEVNNIQASLFYLGVRFSATFATQTTTPSSSN